MKITVLAENTTRRADLTPEHGLSLFIETAHHTILFDMGQTDAFLHNADILGVDLQAVDVAVLSHGHYDHGGGMAAFLKRNAVAPVYLQRRAFGRHKNGADKYIGLDPALCGCERLRFVDEVLCLDEELTLLSCNDRPRAYPTDPFGLTREENGVLVPDDFLHEQYLLIRKTDRTVLISGCSHKGILNIAAWFAPDALVGGFHLSKLDPQIADDAARLDAVADTLLSHPTTYYTAHCTGTATGAYLKTRMRERLHTLSTGDVILL